MKRKRNKKSRSKGGGTTVTIAGVSYSSKSARDSSKHKGFISEFSSRKKGQKLERPYDA